VTDTPRGQGRKGGERFRRAADAQRLNAMASWLSQPTKTPRPEWMLDPSKLPKRPPGAT
jgi:hypothetical protein